VTASLMARPRAEKRPDPLARTGFRSQRPQELAESATAPAATTTREAFHRRDQRGGGGSLERREQRQEAEEGYRHLTAI